MKLTRLLVQALAVVLVQLAGPVLLAQGDHGPKPPDCKDPKGNFTLPDIPKNLYKVFDQPGCTHSPSVTTGGLGGGTLFSDTTVDDTGTADVNLGPLGYSTGLNEKWPNPNSGPEVLPGAPPPLPEPFTGLGEPVKPGPRSPYTTIRKGNSSTCPGQEGNENDICTETTCPGCGQVTCDCGYMTTSPPKWGPLKPVMQVLGLGPGASGGGHALVYGAPGSGSFYYEYHAGPNPAPDTGYVEVRAVDGAITRYAKFATIYGDDFFRPAEYVDAYDNVTRYEYEAPAQGGRLWKVHYPTGIDEVWNYSPSWIGTTSGKWDATIYSGVEITYVDITSDAKDLSAKTYGLLFYRLRDSQGSLVAGSKPFAGDRLFRVYHAKSKCLDDIVAPNEIYTVPANHSLTARHSVLELEYYADSDLAHFINFRVADGLLASSTVSAAVRQVEYTYVTVAGQPRVQTEHLPVRGVTHTFNYTVDPADSRLLDMVERYDAVAGVSVGKLTKMLDDHHRVTQLLFEPSATGRPRAVDPDNGGFAEPPALTYNYQYSACVSCSDRPTVIEELPSTRRTEYDYDAVSGLVTKMRESNPAGGTGLVETVYQWQPVVPGVIYGAYKLTSVTYPDGKQWTYSYVSVPRLTPAGYENWGLKHQSVTASTPVVTTADAQQGALNIQHEYNVNAPLLDGNGLQVQLVGQCIRSTDGDGVITEYGYATRGTLMMAAENPGGAANEVVTLYDCDRWGTITEVTENATSTAPLVTDFTIDGAGMLIGESALVAGQLLETKYFHDRLGNLSVRLRKNRTSTGAAPDDFGPQPRADVAREWLRDEWHYEGNRLVAVFRDRRSLDRDDDVADPVSSDLDARYVREDIEWRPQGGIARIEHENGSATNFTYDDYGTLYKAERTMTGQPTLLLGKWFINDALEVVREYRGDQNVPLVTSITRNHAGFVTGVAEPNWTPVGYPWSTDPATYAYTRDVMGRLLEASTSGAGGMLERTKLHRDEIGRVWKTERFEGTAPSASQTYTTTWSGATKATKVEGPAGRSVSRTYDALARVIESTNSMPGHPDKVVFEFDAKTHFVKKAKRRNWDPLAAPTADYVTRDVEYVRDNLGRVLQLKVGQSENPLVTPLVHEFAYYGAGFTEKYTDPSGKVERFLPDAMGRLAERFLPGTAAIWNGSTHLDWTGVNGRTELQQVDGRDRLTRTVYDFAGRPVVVMEPGADIEPAVGSEHQQFARLFAYDAASRLTTVYGGDGVTLTLDRDGMGRTLMRTRVPSAFNPLLSNFYGKDEIRRNALGQITETRSYLGPELGGAPYVIEQFVPDALGRLHEERFAYIYTTNVTEIESAYTGGDPVRSGLRYRNNLTGDADDLWLQHVPDAVGRLQGIDWKLSDPAGWTPLAAYQHEGGAIRRRTTSWGLENPSPPSPGGFDTTYEYDPYGRMKRIDQSFSTQASVEFQYDLASNLLKEVYNKQGGGGTRKGDRFAYDEHHRLWKAWLGSDQTHLNETNPESAVGAFVQKLTYGLDEANNRTGVTTQDGQAGTPSSSLYTVQDASHSQGESNRYDTIDGDQMFYDSRGNTGFDGRFYYVYDAFDRLTEVYAVQGTQLQVGGGGSQTATQSIATEPQSFVVSDPSALRLARTAILGRVASQPHDLFLRSDDPSYLPTLREPLSAAVVQFSTPSSVSSTSAATSASTQDSFALELVAIYLYDPMNRRVVRSVAGQVPRYYAWDGWQEAQEMVLGADGTESVARPEGQFVWGEQLDELVSYRTKATGSWANYYIAEGGAHCPSRVLDTNGNVVEIQEYDPYGKTTFWSSGASADASSHGNAFGWKAHRIDSETGLVYMRHRYYSPTWGRFVSQDPLGVWADWGCYGNNYSYGGCRPLTEWDPCGLQVVTGPNGVGYLKQDYDNMLWFNNNWHADKGSANTAEEQAKLKELADANDRAGFDKAADEMERGSWKGDFAEKKAEMQADLDASAPAAVGLLGAASVGGAAAGLAVGYIAVTLPGASLVMGTSMLGGVGLGAMTGEFDTTEEKIKAGVEAAGAVLLIKIGPTTRGSAPKVCPTRASGNPLLLEKQLRSEGQVAEINAGKGRVIGGGNSGTPVHDVERLVRTYGGRAEDWTKVSSSATTASDGTFFETHAYRNQATGAVQEAKTKFPRGP